MIVSSRRLRPSTCITASLFGAFVLLTFLYAYNSRRHASSWPQSTANDHTKPVQTLIAEFGTATTVAPESKSQPQSALTSASASAPAATPTPESGPVVDWSRFAYVQYVTDGDYLCNAVMMFEALHRLESKADRVMLYPSSMVEPDAVDWETDDARLLLQARDEYKVKLQPIEIQHREGTEETWADSFTKLLAFNQTQYDRVLSLDSDSTILQHMDELFLLPSCPVAMPRAYWLYPDKQILSSQVILAQPDAKEFERIMDAINNAGENDYDMEIMNNLYKDSALIIPHRPYGMLTSEFRTDNHVAYLGSDREKWDATTIFNEAKFLHFSDWPIPKPWIEMPEDLRDEKQPACHDRDGVELCIERELWNGFYHDFAERRAHVCKYPLYTEQRKRWLLEGDE